MKIGKDQSVRVAIRIYKGYWSHVSNQLRAWSTPYLR
jgi:hypothetical protein